MDKGWVPLVVGLAALLVGWVIGFFDSNLRAAKKIREAEAKAKFEIEKAAKVVDDTEKTPATKNLLRLWHDADHKLNVELDGKLVTLRNLEPDQRSRLVDLLDILHPWVKGREEAAQAAAPQPVRPIMNPLVAAAAVGAKVPTEPQAMNRPGSMIDQINTVLQKKMAGTALEMKGIRLQESLTGAIWIYVGLKRYEGIDAVPDAEIQQAIRQAVAEWERMNS